MLSIRSSLILLAIEVYIQCYESMLLEKNSNVSLSYTYLLYCLVFSFFFKCHYSFTAINLVRPGAYSKHHPQIFPVIYIPHSKFLLRWRFPFVLLVGAAWRGALGKMDGSGLVPTKIKLQNQ